MSAEAPRFAYRRAIDHTADPPARHPIVVVGAGPVGLTMALALAIRGQPVVLLDDSDRIGIGSRAICWAQRSLDILAKLGVGDRMAARGVTWRRGKVFHRDRLVFAFDLQPDGDTRMPAFVNLQQFEVEAILAEVAAAEELIDLRWRSRVVDLRPADDHVEIAIDTPDGPTRLTADWLVACDGAKSPVRDMLGLAFDGASFEDRFLIADVRMLADFPTERWFWFDPPFHPGRSALLHRQPDDVWRIDLQLGPDADPAVERLPERVVPRLRAMLGESVPFELVWTSVYGFQCRRLQRFTHGRVMFAGDSAHQVSPFGARGANSGIQDADNLAWKLDLVLRGAAPAGLIASYDAERVPAADENIGHSTRATDFIAPVSPMAQAMRATVLEFAHDDPNFRALVNSGRLSRASSYPRSPLVTPDTDDFIGGPGPGDPPIDAPLFDADGRPTWLLDRIGHGFTLLTEAERPASADAARSLADALGIALLSFGAAGAFMDPDGVTRRRWDGRDGTVWLLRPDGHVAARSRAPTKPWLATALARACGHVT